MLPTGEAEAWVETNSEPVQLMRKPNLTQNTVDSFKVLFIERFLFKVISLTVELSD